MDRLINLKNVSCITIQTNSQYWGRHWNSEDYGFKEIYSRVTRNSKTFQVKYCTVGEQGPDFCPLRGTFQHCEDCGDWDREENFCHGKPEEVTVEELKDLIGRIAAGKERLLRISEVTEFDRGI